MDHLATENAASGNSSAMDRNASFFAGYRPAATGFDEIFGAIPDPGRLSSPMRPYWADLDASLGRLGHDGFERRWAQSGQMLRENGIAYGSSGQSSRISRPWRPDPLPLLIPAREWTEIATAVEQRARLLAEILADLYGPQRLLRSGMLPPELVFRHPLFRRSLWSDQPDAARSFLQIYATDIARDAEGKWWVLGDRTETPSGLGFALENRLLISRMLRDPFHSLRVKRLASFFIHLRESIASLAPVASGPNPRVVMLTRGEGSTRYFEDAFLARYLGYTLVQGQDLAVRGNRLMFKTLGGLLPVDVVLRRPDTSTLDPLEIASHERNGSASLFQSLRLGHVGMANYPGSGLVETPAFMPFIPFLCEQLLGEPLKFPAVATWWLGAEAQRRRILRRLDDVDIRPAFERPGPRADAECARLAAMPRTQLLETIASRPYDFVAQERVVRSTIPLWDQQPGAAAPRDPGRPLPLQCGRAVVRVFQVRSADGHGYVTMDGGLARVRHVNPPNGTGPTGKAGPTAGRSGIAGRAEEYCKDVWILSETPVRDVSLLDHRSERIELRRGGAELPSRVAENLFWVGRHLERTEAAARLLRGVVLRLTGEDDLYQLPEMSMLLRAMVGQDQIDPDYAVPDMSGSLSPLEHVLPRLVFDRQHQGSLRSRAETLVRTASTVRDRLSFDSWRAIRKVGDAFDDVDANAMGMGDVLESSGETIRSLAAFSGLASESMTRTPTWRFMDLGRRIERAAQSVAILLCACEVEDEISGPMFVALLENADSLMTYRSRYQSGLRLGPVCDLLMSDPSNPRAIAYQLLAVVEHVQRLPGELHREPDQHLQELAAAMLDLVGSFDLASLDSDHPQSALLPLLQTLDEHLPKFSDVINHRYFVHAPTARPLGGLEVP